VTKRSPFILEHGQRICRAINTDCLPGMSEYVKPGTIDVVVTSPPYNLGTAYGAYDDALPRNDYLDWTDQWIGTVAERLSDQGSLFLNVGSKPSDPTVPFEVLARAQRHLKLQNVIHWVKSISIQEEDIGSASPLNGSVSIGHFKPINSPRFLNDCHEYIFHLTRSGSVALDRLAVGVSYQDKSNVSRWKSAGNDRRCRGNTWFIPYRTIRSRAKQRPHPATFPVKIPQMCIQLHGLPDNSSSLKVMDPFLGIGNTALACLDLGVDFTGFEIDPDYFAEACRQIKTVGSESGWSHEEESTKGALT